MTQSLQLRKKIPNGFYNDANINAQIVLLRANPHNIDPRFLAWCFDAKEIQCQVDQLQTGTALKQLPVNKLLEIRIPIPPIAQQRRIADILDRADAVRRKRKEAITLTEELLRSAFLEMFGDPVANPKGWEVKSLGELLAEPLQNGAYFPKDRYVEDGTGTEMVHMSDAFYGVVERGKLKQVTITSIDVEKYGLAPNDILIARRSLNYEGSAKPCLIPASREPLIFESSLIRVRLDQDMVDPIYFYSYMLEPRAREAYIFPNVTKSTISGINQAGLQRVPVLATPNFYAERLQKAF